MHRLCFIVLALMAALTTGVSGEDAKKDLAKLQGVWTVSSAVKEGQEVAAEQLADFKLIVEGNKRTLKKGDQVVSESTFKIDPAKSPKAMFLTITEGPFKGKTLPAIYDFDGDTHRVCVALNGIEPPAAFATEAGDGQVLQVFKKE